MHRTDEASEFDSLFHPSSAKGFFVFFCFTLLLNFSTDFLNDLLPLSLSRVLSVLLLSALFLGWWMYDKRRGLTIAKLIAFPPVKEQPRPAHGLTLLLSPFDPRDAELRKQEILSPLIDALRNKSTLDQGDFDKINLLNSNLRPQIKAVEYHHDKGNLGDVWLITSESDGSVKGSEGAGIILEKYLRFKYGDALRIHREGFSAKEWDYKGLWELGEKIFRESSLKEKVIVVDITGGNKLMSVALAMSCIPPRRRMQYVYSERDSVGEPLAKGAIEPVTIDVDPILYGRS